MKFTAQVIKLDLQNNNPKDLENYKVNTSDRLYQFWERNSLSTDLFTQKVFNQKMEYIHNNPVKAGLSRLPEQYYYSSAKFYATGIDDFNMLSH